MKRKETEIHEWSEIFRNEKYKQLESLNGIVAGNEDALARLLSIRIPIYGYKFSHQLIDQYNIETKKYITNLTTHNGLDFHLTQYNKFTNARSVYSPYSDAWYNVYVDLLCAYHEIFRKRPILNFPDTDVEWWNHQIKNRDVPLMREMMNAYREAYSYLHQYKFFQKDAQWVHRIVPLGNKERIDEWFGIQWDEIILQFIDHFYDRWSTHKFFIEKELINLFIQMFIDINRRTSWQVGNLNLKKISDVIYTVLESPQIREKDSIDMKIRYEELKTE